MHHSTCVRQTSGFFLFDAGVRLNNSSIAIASAHGPLIITTRGDTLEPLFVAQKNVHL
jgi:hypothetical protein